jgi:hypothetical protein
LLKAFRTGKLPPAIGDLSLVLDSIHATPEEIERIRGLIGDPYELDIR